MTRDVYKIFVKRLIIIFSTLFLSSSIFSNDPSIPSEEEAAQLNYIYSFTQQGLYKEAKELFEKAVKDENPHYMTFYATSICNIRNEYFNDYNRAHSLLIRSIQLGNLVAIQYLNECIWLVDETFRQEKFKESIQLLTELYKQNKLGRYISHLTFLLIQSSNFDAVKTIQGPKRVLLGVGLAQNKLPDILEVETIFPDTPASRSTIQIGDVLMELGGEEIKNFSELQSIQQNLDGGEITSLKVKRVGRQESIPIKLDIASYPNERDVLYSLIRANKQKEAYQIAKLSKNIISIDAKDYILCHSNINKLEENSDVNKGISYCKNIIERFKKNIFEANEIKGNEIDKHMEVYRAIPIAYDLYRQAMLLLANYYTNEISNDTVLKLAKEYFELGSYAGFSGQNKYNYHIVLSKLGYKEKAFEELEIAAKMDFGPALYWIGNIYLDKNSPYYDIDKGINSMHRAREQNIKGASFALSRIYIDKKHIKKDLNRSNEYLIESANKNFPRAVFTLGANYFDGTEGFKKNQVLGKKLILKSEALGYDYAKFIIAHLTFSDPILFDPSPKEIEEREEIYVQRAKNLEFVYTVLGTRFAQGFGVQEDQTKACEYFEKLADMDNHYGIFMYASCNSVGDTETVYLLEKSSKLGISKASNMLGRCYEKGECGLEPSLVKAQQFYTSAFRNRLMDPSQKDYLPYYAYDYLQVDKEIAKENMLRVNSLLVNEDKKRQRDKERFAKQETNKKVYKSKADSYGFGDFLGDLFKVAVTVAIANEAVEVWEETSDANKNAILEGLSSSLNNESNARDYDWDWDAFYDQYGNLQWRCRGIQTGRFASNYNCSSDYKDDDRWPRK